MAGLWMLTREAVPWSLFIGVVKKRCILYALRDFFLSSPLFFPLLFIRMTGAYLLWGWGGGGLKVGLSCFASDWWSLSLGAGCQ